MNDVKFWKEDGNEYMSYYDDNGEYHVSCIKSWFDEDEE